MLDNQGVVRATVTKWKGVVEQDHRDISHQNAMN